MSYKGVFVLFSVTPHNSNNLSDDILIIYTESCYNFVWSLKNSHQKKIWNLKISNTWHGNVLFFDKRSRLIEIFHKHLILQILFFTENIKLTNSWIFRITPFFTLILKIHIRILIFLFQLCILWPNMPFVDVVNYLLLVLLFAEISTLL